MVMDLLAAIYRPVPDWIEAAELGSEATQKELGALLADQTRRVLVGAGPEGAAGANSLRASFVVSTMLDLPFTSGWLRWSKIAEAAAQPGLPRLGSFTAAYECASWGYCLRYAVRVLDPGALVLIHVLDVNIFGFDYWKRNDNWGQSGFGVASLLVRLKKGAPVECHLAQSHSGYGEFCLDLRRALSAYPEAMLVPPFFPAEIASMFTRIIPETRRTENLAPRYGHCFGSDPWVALAELGATGAPEIFARDHLATSVALNGYWTFAPVRLSPGGAFAVLPPWRGGEVQEGAAKTPNLDSMPLPAQGE